MLNTGNGGGRAGAIQRRLGYGAAAGGKMGKRKKRPNFGQNASTGGKMGRY